MRILSHTNFEKKKKTNKELINGLSQNQSQMDAIEFLEIQVWNFHSHQKAEKIIQNNETKKTRDKFV